MPNSHRQFSLVHISDLHLNGEVRRLRNLQTLLGTIRTFHPKLHKRAILLVTGDITDSPTKRALTQARSLFDGATKHFEKIFYVPGNHDAKRVIGNFFNSKKFERSFASLGPMLFDDLGLLIVGFDSNKNDFARGQVEAHSFDALMNQGPTNGDVDGSFGQQFRLALLHHHPLPFPQGEGHTLIGRVEEEPFLYLKNPGRFLHSCMSWNIRLVLHGHKHIHGLARYSVPTPRTISDASSSSSRWDTIHVLSCPSTSGIGCEAGFNVIDFDFEANAPNFAISRYARTNKNAGAFAPIDVNEPEGCIRIYLADSESDPAINGRRRLALFEAKPIAERDLFPVVEGFFRRGAFRFPHTTPGSWNRFYYSVVLTRITWDEAIIPRLSSDRRTLAVKIVGILNEYEELLAREVLRIGDETAAELKARITSGNKERVLRSLPVLPMDWINQHQASWDVRRANILEKLEAALGDMGMKVHLDQRPRPNSEALGLSRK